MVSMMTVAGHGVRNASAFFAAVITMRRWLARGERNATLQTIDRLAKALKVEPAELFLFRPQQVGKSMSLLDARLVDLWKGAGEKQREKMIRVASEILT